jgi:hypothetical protein
MTPPFPAEPPPKGRILLAAFVALIVTYGPRRGSAAAELGSIRSALERRWG